jgi:hypothetical protein
VPDADEMRGPFKPDQIERIKTLRTHCIENAATAPGEAKFPVILFSPGGGMKALTYHALHEDLASWGFVVVAVDPPYNARSMRLPDGRVLGNLKPSERGWPQPKNQDEEIRNYRERVAHWARDLRFVVDQLNDLSEKDGPLRGRLDLARGVGVFGHSRGGQAAGSVRLIDGRIRGGVNLDGMAGPHVVQPIAGENAVGSQPFLWIHKALPNPTDEQLQRARRTRAEFDKEIERITASWDDQLGRIKDGALRVCFELPDLEHIDFSDEPFWDGRLTAESRPGKEETIAKTRAWLRAFFAATLLSDWAALEKLSSPPTQTGISVHASGRLGSR